MRHFLRHATFLSAAALTASFASGCGDDHPKHATAIDPSSTGLVNLALTGGNGITLNRVEYVVTSRHGEVALQNSVDLSDPQSTFFIRFSLPADTGYTIKLTAKTTDARPCAGSVTFDVIAGATQQVSVDLVCEGEAVNGNGTGNVVVNGTVVAGPSVQCPEIASLTAAPLQTSVGGTIALTATGTSATVALGWSATSGTLSSATGGATTFTCTTPGTSVITLKATQAPSCSDEESVQISCVGSGTQPPASDAGAPPASDAGAPPPADAGAPPASDAGAPPPAGPRSVTIRFRAKVSGAAFACGQNYLGQGATSVTATPSDFRFFVNNVRLITATGSEVPVTLSERAPWQTADVALVDFEDGQGACANGNPAINTEITGTVPAGTYTGIAFSNGIPAALNHGNPATAPAPLQNAPGALWTWLSGYKFILAELTQVAPAGQAAGIGLTHVGSTACSGSPQSGGAVSCAKPNRNEIRLTGFDPDKNAIVADLGNIFAGTDLAQDAQCHSSGTFCAPSFARLGLDFATGQATGSQQTYSVE